MNRINHRPPPLSNEASSVEQRRAWQTNTAPKSPIAPAGDPISSLARSPKTELLRPRLMATLPPTQTRPTAAIRATGTKPLLVSEMRSEYLNEEVRKPGGVPVKYLDKEERKQYLVTAGPNGEALDGRGLPLDTTRGGRGRIAIGTLDEDNKLYIAHRSSDNENYRIQHSSFVAGGRAAAAFEVYSTDGKSLSFSPISGHYHSTPEQMEQLRYACSSIGITAEIEIKAFKKERLSIF